MAAKSKNRTYWVCSECGYDTVKWFRAVSVLQSLQHDEGVQGGEALSRITTRETEKILSQLIWPLQELAFGPFGCKAEEVAAFTLDSAS